MREMNEHIEALIARYLSGEALPEEAMELEEWKQQHPDNLKHWEKSQQAYFLVRGEQNISVDAAAMYRNVLAQLDVQKEGKVLPIDFRRYFTPLRIAAVLVVLITGGLLLSRLSKQGSSIDIALNGGENGLSKTLDDGTQVELDKNSSLTLLAGYNGKQRRIKLTGKATFKVEHDAGKPFIVEAGGVLIQDIGTVFEVKAQPDEDTVEVWVTEGIVEMFTENDTLRLTQNQRGYYVPALNKIYDERLLQQAIEDNSRIFHFSNTTLGEVIQQLNAVYPTPIRLSNAALERCRITVDFTNEPQEVVVEIIAETLGLQVESTHGKYTLKGEACNP